MRVLATGKGGGAQAEVERGGAHFQNGKCHPFSRADSSKMDQGRANALRPGEFIHEEAYIMEQMALWPAPKTKL